MNAENFMRPVLILAIVTMAALAGCETTPTYDEAAKATAALKPTKGNKTYGEVTFEQAGDKVRVVANVVGLKPNQEYGFHIHEVGDCSSGDGMSAKGHFNPYGKPHGHYGGMERHAGPGKIPVVGPTRLSANYEKTCRSPPAAVADLAR